MPRRRSAPEPGLPRADEDEKSRMSSTSWERVSLGKVTRQTTHLERDADVPAIGICGLLPDLALSAAPEHDGSAGALGHQGRGLEIRLPEVCAPPVLVRHLRVQIDLAARALHLQNLAFGQVGDDARDQLDDLVVPESGERCAGSAEQKVAPEDGKLVSKGGWCRGRAASEVGLVDDVVVEEGRDVYHFDDLGETQLGREEGVCQMGHRVGAERRGRGGEGAGRGRTEVKGGVERGGVVGHGGVEVVEHVRAREGGIELLGGEAGVFCGPEPEGEVGAEAVGGAGEEEDEEGTELLRGVVEVVRRDLGERRVRRAEQADERRADVAHLRLEQRVRVDPSRGRERRRPRRGRCKRARRMAARMSCQVRPHRRHSTLFFFFPRMQCIRATTGSAPVQATSPHSASDSCSRSPSSTASSPSSRGACSPTARETSPACVPVTPLSPGPGHTRDTCLDAHRIPVCLQRPVHREQQQRLFPRRPPVLDREHQNPPEL
jgi:hypothetical protein